MYKKAALHLALWVLWLSAPHVAVAQAPLTFEERVKAQEAIERVYYAQRIWPKENPGPKPAFEKVIPRKILESKVTDYLRKSAALEQVWQRPLTAEQLQAEMDRMARETRDPATLKALFAALGDDPRLVAECLARPLLARRLARGWSVCNGASPTDPFSSSAAGDFDLAVYQEAAGDFTLPDLDAERSPEGICTDYWGRTSFGSVPDGRSDHVAVWTGTEMIIWGGRDTAGARYNLSTDTWAPLPMTPDCAIGRGYATAVWTGTEMIVWGGSLSTNQGGRYSPASDSWRSLSTGANCPAARMHHTAVWTGTAMIVWAGRNSDTWFANGGLYNPASDTWLPVATSNSPTGRANHTAVWTGSEMIVWGGWRGYTTDSRLGDGGRYNPASDTWSPVSASGSSPGARRYHTAVWTGSVMVVWGGEIWKQDSSQVLPTFTGGRYNPVTDSWQPTSLVQVPEARREHLAVWTGALMIIWGGVSSRIGGLYDPAGDTWRPTAVTETTPADRYHGTAVWTGSEMIVWGGLEDDASGGRYSPTTDTWVPTAMDPGCPPPSWQHTALWTGAELIVWGGYHVTGSDPRGTGGRYDFATASWTPTSRGDGCPSYRDLHTAVWTGTEMIVWGGWSFDNTGGRYNPATDTWVATSTGTFVPEGRQYHTAVWSGTEMVVWGGSSSDALNSGGRYNPATDNWRPTTTTACPTARLSHTALWTGSKMLVFGGSNSSLGVLKDGGLYDPVQNTWTAITPAAVARTAHGAVWTGTEMIVWGGSPDGIDPVNSGGRYTLSTGQWRTTSTGPNCPAGRFRHTVVWTGSEMVIWGGRMLSGTSLVTTGTGGRYNPVTDLWLPTQSAGAPPARAYHSATWNGTEMAVWGGGASIDGQVGTHTGGLYGIGAPPTPPAAISAQDVDSCTTGIRVTWPANPASWRDWGNSGTRTYRVFRDGVPLASGGCGGTLAYGTTACEDATTSAGTAPIYKVAYTNACGLVALSPAVEVDDVATVPPAVSGPTANTCPATTVLLSVPSVYTAYQWLRGGTPIPGAAAPSYEATLSGSYSVDLTLADGCALHTPTQSVSVTFCSESEVSPAAALFPGRLVKSPASPTGYFLFFQRMDGATGYNLYEGSLGVWYSHGSAPGNMCGISATDLTTGEMRVPITPTFGNHYYLVAARDAASEGPTGYASSGALIPSALSTCVP